MGEQYWTHLDAGCLQSVVTVLGLLVDIRPVLHQDLGGVQAVLL